MGFKRYLSWNDAVYGNSGFRFNFNHYIPTNCTMVTKCDVSIALIFYFLLI